MSTETTLANNYGRIEENKALSKFLIENYPSSDVTISQIRIDVLAESDKIREELISLCGGLDENGFYTNPLEEKKVYEFFITQNNGNDFQELVNSISVYSNQLGVQQNLIALDAKDIPVFKHDPNQAGKTFSDINFSKSNLIEALNVMAVVESSVVQVESVFLNRKLVENIKKSM